MHTHMYTHTHIQTHRHTQTHTHTHTNTNTHTYTRTHSYLFRILDRYMKQIFRSVKREHKVFQSDWSVTRGHQTVRLCDGVRDQRRLVHASIGVQPPELLHRNHSCPASRSAVIQGMSIYYAPSQFVRFINEFDRLSLAEGYFFQNEYSFNYISMNFEQHPSWNICWNIFHFRLFIF